MVSPFYFDSRMVTAPLSEEWKNVRERVVSSRRRIIPVLPCMDGLFQFRQDYPDQYEDISELSYENQEIRARTGIHNLVTGMAGLDVRINIDPSGIHSLSINPSFDPRIRTYIDVCRGTLLYMYTVSTKSAEVLSDPESPNFGRCVMEVLSTYVKEVQNMSINSSRLIDLVHELQHHKERMKVCAELTKSVLKREMTAKAVMDVVADIHRKAVLPDVDQLLSTLQTRVRTLFVKFVLHWIMKGECFSDGNMEFMIWPLDRLGPLSETLKESTTKKDTGAIIFLDKHCAIRDLCPTDWLPEFPSIVAAGKYVRMLRTLGVTFVHPTPTLDRNLVRSSVQCRRAIASVCRAASGRLLSHIQQIYSIETIFESVNAIYLEADGNFNTVLVRICDHELYKPTDEVSKRTLERRLQKSLQYEVSNVHAIMDNIHIEFSHLTLFASIGSTETKADPDAKPVVLSSLKLTWNPSYILSQIWTSDVCYYLSLVQRFLFTLTAVLYRLEERAAELSRSSCKYSEERQIMFQVGDMHAFLVSLLTWAQYTIQEEVNSCRKALGKANSVEEMCECLRSRLTIPLTSKLLCLNNRDSVTVTHIEKVCDAIHSYLVDPEDSQYAYNAFSEARSVVRLHMANTSIQKF